MPIETGTRHWRSASESRRHEQSNTPLRVGSTLVFKLFRRLESGENPELDLGRFLTSRTSFRAMSALEGSLTYHTPSGASATLGVLQTWIDNLGDGWSYVLSALAESRRTARRRSTLGPDMTQLGMITSDFHSALESDRSLEAFRPESVKSSDVDAWSAQLRDRVARVCALIEPRLDAWPDESRRLGKSLLEKSRIAHAIASAGGGGSASFSKIRIHGDYHLGQTLKTASGFTIIDFEGEPATPITARQQKHCALKDVAGMLRSFDYAIETASEQKPDTPDRSWAPPDLRQLFPRLFPIGWGARDDVVASFPFGNRAVADVLRAREGVLRAGVRDQQPANVGTDSTSRHPAGSGCSRGVKASAADVRTKEVTMPIRKHLVEPVRPATPREWLAVVDVAQIELTSEALEHPIESALIEDRGIGWRASRPGEQRIRLVFDQPQAIRLIHLVFEDAEQERLQEFVLRGSSDRGLTYVTLVRQQFFFNPSGATREVEDYAVNLEATTDIELHIIPDLSGRPVFANLKELRISGRGLR